MKNVGKQFEAQIKASTPEYALLYRLPDSAQSFGGSNKLRFSNKPPFDFLLWDSLRHKLYALETKTVQGKSISFERSKDEHAEIHYHQICGLNNWNKYDGVTCGFIIEFRALEKTVFIEIEEMNKLISLTSKRSFNYNDLNELGILYVLIGQKKARTRYTYDLDEFLRNQ